MPLPPYHQCRTFFRCPCGECFRESQEWLDDRYPLPGLRLEILRMVAAIREALVLKPLILLGSDEKQSHLSMLSVDCFVIIASFLDKSDVQSARLAGRELNFFLSP